MRRLIEMSDEIIKLNINYGSDREDMIRSLANAGYPVYVEESKDILGTKYFVCFCLPKENAR
jgi:hypothetical protein